MSAGLLVIIAFSWHEMSSWLIWFVHFRRKQQYGLASWHRVWEEEAETAAGAPHGLQALHGTGDFLPWPTSSCLSLLCVWCLGVMAAYSRVTEKTILRNWTVDSPRELEFRQGNNRLPLNHCPSSWPALLMNWNSSFAWAAVYTTSQKFRISWFLFHFHDYFLCRNTYRIYVKQEKCEIT